MIQTLHRFANIKRKLTEMALDWISFHCSELTIDSALHQTAYSGKYQNLLSLLEKNSLSKNLDLNARNRLGCTPLRLAATAGHEDCVRLLLRYGAKVNLADIKEQTPLFVAVKNHHTNCIRALLDAGADPNGCLQNLCSPIYIAAMDGFLKGVEELLNYGADPDISQLRIGTFNSTPAYIAIAYHHFDCFRALILAGADPNGIGNMTVPEGATGSCPSLYHAAVRHNVELNFVTLLYESGASLYRRDSRGRLAHETDVVNECSLCFKRLIAGEPRSLMSTCRIAIRKFIGRRRLQFVNELPLPKRLINYVNHKT